ncbi:hypothetical protein [Crenobacter luteus]|uniref:hypothetical protein n=1 Tax=Crenobacter luteus TaxID=1452487 RepID=UPI001E5B37C3|nr:hypothetical protein [Crenobacter luteus]
MELDAATRQRLAEEVERLVRMGMDRKKARRIVWDDYLDELAAYAAPAPPEPEPPQPELSPPQTPVPEPPKSAPPVTKPVAERIEDSHAAQAAPKAPFFTPERLQRNRAELAKVKRLIGLRS